MSVRQKIPYNSGIFYFTFTCARWIPLFEITRAYHLVYKFFDHLKEKGHFVNAYVIMPDHVHTILSFMPGKKDINRIIGDGKRFMTYDLIQRLQNDNQTDILKQLCGFVNDSDRKKGKLHEAFEPSFDWKHCYSDDFIEQKLNYIHMNPCVCKPPLAATPLEYLHSSANYYFGGDTVIYPVEHVMKMKDINFDQIII